jgi:hypothetical protein
MCPVDSPIHISIPESSTFDIHFTFIVEVGLTLRIPESWQTNDKNAFNMGELWLYPIQSTNISIRVLWDYKAIRSLALGLTTYQFNSQIF